jgi:hypothetical protein
MEDTIMKTFRTLGMACLLGAALAMPFSLVAGERDTGRGTGPVIYVTSLDQYFDSIVLGDLPMQGRFQQLIPGENGLETEFGPGQPGHLGGRWWVDANEDGQMNTGDMFFLCPLLGPGRDQM